MEKSRRSKPQVGKDRLSELPDSVIFHILWFVPLCYAVRTTFLSKRWRNLWTTTPFLNFDEDEYYMFGEDDRDRFWSSINRALLRWNGVRILKFRVNSGTKLPKRIFRDTELYAHFAKEKGVEEFYLHLPFVDLCYYSSGNDVYFVPQCLYSCSSLKLLSLRFCEFKIDGNVHWNQLKSLTIAKAFGFTEHVMNQILCGSPKLEVLRLSVVDEGHNLNVRSDSLKELCICKRFPEPGVVSKVSELTIWTPNLETLTIKGTPYCNCRVINVKSSVHVTLGFYGALYNEDNDCDFWVSKDSISSQDYIAEKIHQVLETIQHFERVTLFCCCLQVLAAMKVRCMHSSFPNVKSLEIGCHCHNYGEFVGYLDIFPQLRRLVLQADTRLHFYPVYFDELKCKEHFPKCLLPQLRTIEVDWSSGDNIFSSIESLLKHASKLEKLVFRVDSNGGANSLSLSSNKLLNMPRSSANCTIDILQEDLKIKMNAVWFRRKFT